MRFNTQDKYTSLIFINFDIMALWQNYNFEKKYIRITRFVGSCKEKVFLVHLLTC